eukprot:GHVH01011129.1.p1 GENE.GHVH01011129.1~~GHVH01011129.1.p1  ORF type:complete len:169 (+),score=34.72 GHVH01011129.1:91-597(+)
MPPKADPGVITEVFFQSVGGEAPPNIVLAPKLGPLGMSPKKVGDDVIKGTKEWKGIRVTVKLTVQNRQCQVSVVPTASALIMKALNEPPRDRKKVKNILHDGNISLDVVKGIATQIRDTKKGIPSKSFQGSVKEILGTCNSIGCTVEGKTPVEVQRLITEGEIEIEAC